MGSQSDFFEALGPTENPPNDSPGFFTYATGLWRGADISGKTLGVRGIGTDPGSTGIIGQGGDAGNGVFGQGGAAGNGVVGQGGVPDDHANGGIGVFGTGQTAGILGVGDGTSAVGVRGKSIGGNPGVEGISNKAPGGVGAGPGVKAYSEDGIGLVADGDVGATINGRSSGMTVNADQTGLTVTADTGLTIKADKGGTITSVTSGLESSSEKGAGLRGHSTQDFGGVFKSDKVAQVLIIPHDFDPRQLDDSIAGSLAVNTRRDPETGRVFAQLWFCRIGGAPGTSDWRAIA
jgi:hypothetical protein